MPGIIITEGPRNHCTHAHEFIAHIEAQHLIANNAYDTKAITEAAEQAKINPVIKKQNNPEIDTNLYKLKHLVENTFQPFLGIAIRYAKNTKSYLTDLRLKFLLMWVEIS